MAFGTITIGRLTLREDYDLEANINTSTDRRTISLRGEESFPPLPTAAALAQRQEDILGLLDRWLPITFTDKTDHNGYYKITDINTSLINWTAEAAKFTWTIQALYVGPENCTDIESRLAYVERQDDFGLTGARWHAPAGGHFAYYTGLAQPGGSVSRATVDGGPVTVYTTPPASASPRWGSTLASYGRGRSRVLVGGTERVATNLSVGASAWEMNNGMVSVSAAPSASATLLVSHWDGTAWDPTAWNVSVGSSTTPDLGVFDAATVIRNDYELTTIRLIKSRSPGRTVLDLSLRRGSRFVEGYLQADFGTTLAVFAKTAQLATAPASAGYVVATNNDAQGNKMIVGSARTFVAQTAQLGLHRLTVNSLDFFIGGVVSGSGAPTGDQAANLRDQYLTIPAEVTVAVRR
jgi:hypothetical protein